VIQEKPVTTVLLVEDNCGDARLFREMLKEQRTLNIELTNATYMSEAENHLGEHSVDVILLDLGLPDVHGLEAVRRAHIAAPRVPLVVLTGLDDESLATQALQEGAQDYLIKGQIETQGLLRAIRYAIDRGIADTQKAQLQAKLRQAEKLEAIGTLAGGVAHELNNMLTPIIMTTELVLSDMSEENPHFVMLKRVVDAGGKAAEIVQRILAFGRTDEVSMNALDMSLMLREAVEFIRTILPSSITLHVQIDDLVGMVRGDKTQLTQVLINLATNARDAIDGKVGTVWISLSRLHADSARPVLRVGAIRRGAYAMLTVRDTGSGMNDETMHRIYEPFFTTKSVGKGTGLGLSVTHGIVSGHGGHVHVDSSPGRGTTVYIKLPGPIIILRRSLGPYGYAPNGSGPGMLPRRPLGVPAGVAEDPRWPEMGRTGTMTAVRPPMQMPYANGTDPYAMAPPPAPPIPDPGPWTSRTSTSRTNGNDDTAEMPIYREVEAAWFRDSRQSPMAGLGPLPSDPPSASTWEPPPASAAPPPAWHTAADDGWRAARSAAEAPVRTSTRTGLPKRVPQAQLVPGGVSDGDAAAAVQRNPEDVRGLLSAYHRGVQRGRGIDDTAHGE